MNPMMMPLHHGESDTFDLYDLGIVLAVVVVLAAIGFGIWWYLRRRY